MRRISCQKLARLASGTATANAFVSSIAVDSRQVERGSLFIALQGEMVNGHDYVTDAFERGASAPLMGLLKPRCSPNEEGLGRKMSLRNCVDDHARLCGRWLTG